VLAKDKQRYQVEAFLARRQTAEGDEYYVKWAGYPETANTWEPAHAIKGDLRPLLRELEGGGESNHCKRPQAKGDRAKQTPTSSASGPSAPVVEPAVGSGGAAVMRAPPEVDSLVVGWRVDLPAVVWARNGDSSSKEWAAVQKRGATFEVIVRALMVGAVPLQLWWRIQHQDEPIFDVRTTEIYEYLDPTQQLLVERVRLDLGAVSDVERNRLDNLSAQPQPARHVRMWQGKAAAARAKKGNAKQPKRRKQAGEQPPVASGSRLNEPEGGQLDETTSDSTDSDGDADGQNMGMDVIGEGFDSLSYGAGGASSYYPSLPGPQPHSKRRKQHNSGKHPSMPTEERAQHQVNPWELSPAGCELPRGTGAGPLAQNQAVTHSSPLDFQEREQSLSDNKLSPRLFGQTDFSWTKSDEETTPASPQPPSTIPTISTTHLPSPGQGHVQTSNSVKSSVNDRGGVGGAVPFSASSTSPFMANLRNGPIMPQGLRGTLRVADSGRARQKLVGGVVHSPTAADHGRGGLQKTPEVILEVPLVLDFFGIDGSDGVPDHCKEQLQLARRRQGSRLWEDYNLAFTEAAAQATGAEQVLPIARIPDDQANELWLFARRGESLRCAASVPVVPTHKACVMTTQELGLNQSKYHVITLDENALDAE
jgi:hypothetical protein